MTLQVQLYLFPCRTVRKGYMIVCNVIEKVDLLLLEKQSRGDRMYRCITPSLIEESAVPVESLEVVQISLGPQPIEIADLEIRPLK